MKFAFYMCMVVLFSACASYDDVRPGADGIHRVVVLGDGEGDGERDAIEQARDYCKEVHKQSPVFINEETKYEGQLDEETNKTVRKASKAAGIIGIMTSSPGKRHGNVISGPILGAGAVGGVMTNNTYKTEMKFQCK